LSKVKPPYFYSWSKQTSPFTFDVDSSTDFHYISNNNKVLDFSSTSFQASFGLKNTQITDAITQQSEVLPLATPKATFKLKDDVSIKLKNLISKDIQGRIFWTSSGAESIENALKIARDFTGKDVIVSRQRSYHGASLGALSVGGDWRTQAVSTVDEWTLRIPGPETDPEAKEARKIIEGFGPEKIAGICLEVITGGNGVIVPGKKWYREIQDICDDYNLILILDEVICGFGRTGNDFGFHHYQDVLKPDLICMAKAITGGFFPMGAVWVNESLALNYEHKVLPCGLTNYAHPLGLAATNATLDYYQEVKENSLDKRILFFNDHLSELKNISSVKEIRSIGLLAAIEIDSNLSWKDFIQKRIFVYLSNNILILAPALNMPFVYLEEGFKKINTILGD
jgi:taurine--2-oxoglutarate transaminase